MNALLTTDARADPGPARCGVLYSPWLLNPVILQVCVWGVVVGMYLLRLSHLLYFPTRTAWEALAAIVAPFTTAAICVGMLLSAFRRSHTSLVRSRMRQRTVQMLAVAWFLASIGEIYYSGGLPFVWLFTGGKTYADFGLPSLHGLLDSLILALALVGFSQFLATSRPRHLALPATAALWGILIVNRQILLGIALECGLLTLRWRKLRPRIILTGAVSAVAFICGFGVLGNLRSGLERFQYVSQVSSAFPAWLPSGFLWFYIYLVTPFNNFLYNTVMQAPLGDWHLRHALVTLLPSFLRNGLAAQGVVIAPPLLVNTHFNVCTGYIGVYQDLGWTGVAAFSVLLGAVCTLAWRARSQRGIIIYAVLSASLLESIFVDPFFSLPIIFQAFWVIVMVDTARDRTPARPRPRAIVLDGTPAGSLPR